MNKVATEMTELQKALKDIQKDFGDGSAFLLGENKHVDCEWIKVDSLRLSRIMGGGIPRGKVIEIFGWESHGKTTVASYLIGQAQKAGFNCAFIDAEHAYEPKYARKVGVDIEKLIFAQPDSGEQALSLCEQMIDTIPNLAIIVIDSIASLTPQAEIDGDMGDAHMGLQARLLSQAMRKLTSKLQKKKVTLIAINQIRLKIGIMYGNPETTPGGNAVKFYSSIRLNVRKQKDDIMEGKNLKGIRIKVKAIKNKLATPMREDILDLYFASGFDVLGEVIDFGIHYGIIEKRGGWYYLENQEKFHGKDALDEYYMLHTEELYKLKDIVYAKIEDNSEETDGSSDYE